MHSYSTMWDVLLLEPSTKKEKKTTQSKLFIDRTTRRKREIDSKSNSLEIL